MVISCYQHDLYGVKMINLSFGRILPVAQIYNFIRHLPLIAFERGFCEFDGTIIL
jgi:hypothetical protein